MKNIIILIALFALGIGVNAQEIGVLPISVTKNNAYNFENTSDIIAKEIVYANKNYVQINPAQDMKLKNFMSDKNKSINLDLVKSLSTYDKTLVITSYISDRNNRFFDVWDILKISSDFDINSPYIMEIKALLIDNKENVVLWQKTYEQPLGLFKAQNMTEAIDKKEKIKSYSKNIIAQDITQNIKLRLNHKNIDYASRVPKYTQSDEGIGLKYKNNAPIIKITPTDIDDFEERWRNDDSFNL